MYKKKRNKHDLPAMQDIIGSSTGIKYLWIKTLMVDQKPWYIMTLGKMSLAKDKECPNFLQSWADLLLDLLKELIALANQDESSAMQGCKKPVFF